MDSFSPYVPSLVAAVVLFALLTTNPTWLHGRKYGDRPANQPDPLITSILVFLAGALTCWLVNSRALRY